MCLAKDMPSYSTHSFVFLASSCCQTSPSGFHLALSFGIKGADYRERASLCVSRMNQITKRVDLGSFSRTAHKKQARKGNALQTSRAAGRGSLELDVRFILTAHFLGFRAHTVPVLFISVTELDL